MKYFFKVLLSMMLVVTAAMGALDYCAVSFQMEHSAAQAEQDAMSRHQMVKYSLQTDCLYAGAGADDRWESICTSVDSTTEQGFSLSVNGVPVFDSLQENLTASESVPEEGTLLCMVQQTGGGEQTILVTSCFTQDGDTCVLCTAQDMTRVFTEADLLQSHLLQVYFAVLAVCCCAALLLSWRLTRPLQRLSGVTRAFAGGDYSARADAAGKGEVGLLAQDYNQMADALCAHMDELREEARRQSDFTANFAHELKTPMTGIIGYADRIYQNDLTAAEVHEYAGIIVSEGMRLEALSFKLMELFRAEHGTFVLEEADSAALLQDAADAAAPLFAKNGIALHCGFAAGWVRAEYDLMKTMLLNLLDNAVKSGASEVRFTSERDGDSLRVRVADNGRGMPTEEIGRITEAFYMVDKSRSRAQHGAGLGLALCVRIAEIHHTRLEFRSTVGQGTEVSFCLSMMEEVSDSAD